MSRWRTQYPPVPHLRFVQLPLHGPLSKRFVVMKSELQLKHRLCYCQHTHRRARADEEFSRRRFSPPNTRTTKQRCSNHVLCCPREEGQAQHHGNSPWYQENEIHLFHPLSCRRSHKKQYQGSLASHMPRPTNSGFMSLTPTRYDKVFFQHTRIPVPYHNACHIFSQSHCLPH